MGEGRGRDCKKIAQSNMAKEIACTPTSYKVIKRIYGKKQEKMLPKIGQEKKAAQKSRSVILHTVCEEYNFLHDWQVFMKRFVSSI